MYTLSGFDLWGTDDPVDFSAAYNAGERFAIRKTTEGMGLIEDGYAADIRAIREAGLYAGSYHVFTQTYDAANQAKKFLGTMVEPNGQLPPVLDLEVRGSMDRDQYTKSVQAWLEVVEYKLQVRPILYMNLDFAQHALHPMFGDYPFWFALPGVDITAGWPTVDEWPEPLLLQHDWFATIPGCSNVAGMDHNLYRGTVADVEKSLIRGV